MAHHMVRWALENTNRHYACLANDAATDTMLRGRGAAGMVTNFPEVIRQEREK